MKNATTIIISGQEITSDLATIRAILGLSDIAPEVAMESLAAPKKSAKKSAKSAPKAKAPKAEEPKAEPSDEPKYTKGGLLLQWDDGITAKGKEKAVITKGYNSLTNQGFTVTRKRVGTWVEMYQSGEKRPSKEFAAAKMDKGWQFIKGAWKFPALLESYEDSFRA